MLAVAVALKAADILQFSLGGLIAPATVVGAALGFGAHQLLKDLLAGFFIIAEKQYGFGDLVELTILGSTTDAAGSVENVTLRVTKLRSPDGEVYTVPNGQIVKAVNLSKDWARAVVDIPVPNTAALNRVNEALRQACEHARDDDVLRDLLLDPPTLMGVESIELDTVTLRVVARTLPGKQFEAGRELRGLVLGALARAGVDTSADAPATVGAIVHPATVAGAEDSTQGPEQ
jgi:small conductance mechanosensitive channel